MQSPEQAPAIGDYALIGDCRAAALVSRFGSVDWCCLPNFAAEPSFGRLLDWRRGGHCSIAPQTQSFDGQREYLDDTLILATTFDTPSGSVRVLDFFVIDDDPHTDPEAPQLIRVIEGLKGTLDLEVQVSPRFDFGDVKPWLRQHAPDQFTAVGGSRGLLICGDLELRIEHKYNLRASVRVHAGETRHLGVLYRAPETLDHGPARVPTARDLERKLSRTRQWWSDWSRKVQVPNSRFSGNILRSAIILKALTYAPTGAIIAAPTTSLPEGLSGTRTWDYRFSWLRDAAFTADVLVELGCEDEAYAFRRFLERSSAGSAQQLQTLYGIDGARRQDEFELPHLEGYQGATPVRVGNHASRQVQLDVFGEVLEQSWIWHQRGHSPSEEYWPFLVELVNRVSHHWQDPDHGIWEIRGEPQHYVHSKVMCWSALNRGILLAQDLQKETPIDEWTRAREAVRESVETHGFDAKRGVFMQAYERPYLDAALLRLPTVGFIEFDDPRMVRTTDAIRTGLDQDGLLRRYDSPDGLPGEEGAFLACSFWLAECLAGQHRFDAAQAVFDRAAQTANDLGLFSEEYDVRRQQLLANFPQGLTHLSYISAALALYRQSAVTERRVSA
jgi:GH15 family glucan-1,4-alpha-glucosidase